MSDREKDLIETAVKEFHHFEIVCVVCGAAEMDQCDSIAQFVDEIYDLGWRDTNEGVMCDGCMERKT